jgi:hypothetical protein
MTDPADLPIWLPPLVKERAREAYAGARSAAELAMVKRVTTDLRMAGVWKYLQQKKRKTADYVYPVLNPLPLPGTPIKTPDHPEAFSSRTEWIQQIGLRKLYERTILLGRCCLPSANVTTTFSARRYRQKAAKLQLEAQKLAGKDDQLSHHLEAASHLSRAADWFDGMAAILTANEDNQVAVVMAVTAIMVKFFGKPMYQQSAAIASIMLDREITRDQVRYTRREL